jgi:hypothetical protein
VDMRLQIRRQRRIGQAEWGSRRGTFPSYPGQRRAGRADDGGAVATDWPRLRAAIAVALEPHPEALRAVQEALERWVAA